MLKLRFEFWALEKEPVEITGEWFQITYTTIRDSDGNDIAYMSANETWTLPTHGEFSDVIISEVTENGDD